MKKFQNKHFLWPKLAKKCVLHFQDNIIVTSETLVLLVCLYIFYCKKIIFNLFIFLIFHVILRAKLTLKVPLNFSITYIYQIKYLSNFITLFSHFFPLCKFFEIFTIIDN